MPRMRVPVADFIEDEYGALYIVSVFSISNAADAAAITEVKRYKDVCLGVDEHSSRLDILVGEVTRIGQPEIAKHMRVLVQGML
ncbi:hypothetical protein VCV18_010599 [Metarhizium anisopliae]